MVGVAVNVTDCPAQIAPLGLATILTAGGTTELTVTVIEFDVAVVGLAQAEFDVITQLTICPLVNDEVV